MSSSFTDQPSPHDPEREEGYTPTRPPRRQRDDEDREPDRPRLGSLAQKARGKQLKQARILLFVIGALTIAVNLVDIFVALGQNVPAENQTVLLIACAIDGAFILNGVVFVVLGALIYRFPVVATVVSLVVYILTWGLGVLIALAIDPVVAAGVAGGGIIFRIVVIVVLAKSIQSAFAYERERREEQEYETV